MPRRESAFPVAYRFHAVFHPVEHGRERTGRGVGDELHLYRSAGGHDHFRHRAGRTGQCRHAGRLRADSGRGFSGTAPAGFTKMTSGSGRHQDTINRVASISTGRQLV